MKRNRKWWIAGVMAVIAGLVILASMESRTAPSPSMDMGKLAPDAPSPSPARGRVTMIDLGATECIPCKMMAPIIEELKAEYAGKAEIVFIDV